MKIPEILIENSIYLPLVGLGTWRLKGAACTHIIEAALEMGYRHFDTAHLYENHGPVRKAIRRFERTQLVLTSKFYLSQLEHENLESSCDRALLELGTDYLDLFLMHYPDRSVDMTKVLHDMQELVEKKKIRAIGVSNFTKKHLQDALDQGIHIAVNQVEFHPYLNQKELLSFCRTHNIHLMSFRSLGKGVLVTDPIFENIGTKYHKTPAQISLRWLIEQNISVIPKASTTQHLEENLSLFDFALDAEDHAVLDHLKIQHRFCENKWSDFNYV